MNALLAVGLLLASGTFQPDTTVALRPGDRVVVEDLDGEIEVRAWDRSELSLRGEVRGARAVSVTRQGQRVVVGSADRKGRRLDVALVLRLPSWAALEVRGRDTDVVVEGMTSDVEVRIVEGDITASQVGGVVTLRTVDGRIVVDGVQGRLAATSRGDDVTVRRATGEVEVESGSGNVVMEDVRATSVRARTLDGDLRFQGPLARGGSYWFSVHDGDADIVVPPGTGAQARVSTFDGEFTSDFPVTIQRYEGKGVFDFTLGGGGAGLEIQVFDGEIRLRSSNRQQR